MQPFKFIGMYMDVRVWSHCQTFQLMHTHTHTHSSPESAASVESLQCIQILQIFGANFGVKSVYGATPMYN